MVKNYHFDLAAPSFAGVERPDTTIYKPVRRRGKRSLFSQMRRSVAYSHRNSATTKAFRLLLLLFVKVLASFLEFVPSPLRSPYIQSLRESRW